MYSLFLNHLFIYIIRLNHLLDWTNEVEKLFNHLQSDPSNTKNSDEKTAIELASRYRAMLSRFEEMTGMVNEQNALADKLNLMLVDLSLDGGVSAGEIASKRAALTAALGALKDLGSEMDSVLTRGGYTWICVCICMRLCVVIENI